MIIARVKEKDKGEQNAIETKKRQKIFNSVKEKEIDKKKTKIKI